MRLSVAESTNQSALELVDSGLGDDFAVVAREQTAGRGRLGRSWVSPAGNGLYCSVAARPVAEAARLPQLTLVMAVAAAEAAAEVCGVRLAIKWPNDLYFDGRKVGGILSEIKPGLDAGRDAVVIGIGMNLAHRAGDFTPDLADSVDSLARIAGAGVDGERLLTCLLDRFHAWRIHWEREGFEPVRARWLKHDCTVGKRVTIRGGAAAKVWVENIDAAGFLIVRDDIGMRRRMVAEDIIL